MFQFMDSFTQRDLSITGHQERTAGPLMNLERRYMGNSEIKADLQSKYNNEPVFYCKHCLSLKIRDAGLPDLLYCDDCGSADVLSTSIEEWEKMYKEKYGFKFLDKGL